MIIRASIALLLFATPAVASDGFSGQNFLDASQAFGEGYAFGILEQEVSIVPVTGSFLPYQLRFQSCFLGTGFTSTNLYEAVRRHIESTPASLLQPAFVAVANTLQEICPAPQ